MGEAWLVPYYADAIDSAGADFDLDVDEAGGPYDDLFSAANMAARSAAAKPSAAVTKAAAPVTAPRAGPFGGAVVQRALANFAIEQGKPSKERPGFTVGEIAAIRAEIARMQERRGGRRMYTLEQMSSEDLRRLYVGTTPEGKAAARAELNRIGANLLAAAPQGGVIGGLKQVGGGLGKFVVDVTKTVTSAAVAVTKAPVSLGGKIVSGENIGSSLVQYAKENRDAVAKVAPIAQMVLSFVPGIGTGVSAALGAGVALSKGQTITQALIAGARGAIPGGPIVQAAFDTGMALLQGQSPTEALLTAARNQLPEVSRPAFDVGVALAKGKSIQEAAKTGLASAATELGGKALSAVGGQIGKVMPSIPFTTIPDVVGAGLAKAKALVAPLSILPVNVSQVASALVGNPSLRSLPLADVARRLGVDQTTARAGMASVVQAVQRTGSGLMGDAARSALARAPAVEKQIGSGMTLDRAIAAVGQAAPRAFSPNAQKLSRPVKWRGLPTGAITGIAQRVPAVRALPAAVLSSLGLAHFRRPFGASGLDAAGTGYSVEAGDSMSLIAKKLVGNANRYGELAKANPQVKDPNKIFAGQRLTLPASWVKAPAPGSAAPASPSTLPAVAPQPIAPIAQYVTIGQGSSGATVKVWQKIIRVEPDGIFGPQTKAATVAWQKAHGLEADGVVGPKTWAKALALTPAAASVPAPSSVPASVPGSVYAPPGGLLQVQVMLAHWALATGKAEPKDYGKMAGDVNGQPSDRFSRALKSFQVTFTRTPSGTLDDDTYQRLTDWNMQAIGLPAGAAAAVSTAGAGLGTAIGVPLGMPGSEVPGQTPELGQVSYGPPPAGGMLPWNPPAGGQAAPSGSYTGPGGTVTLPSGETISVGGGTVGVMPKAKAKTDDDWLIPAAIIPLLMFL